MKNRSILRFDRYIVKDIYYKTNEQCLAHKPITLDFDFATSTYISEDQRKMEIELSVDIFKNAEEKNYPFEMGVTVKGFFDVDMDNEEIGMFERNATAILFPYLRAIVSTYTANANITPVILPPMNINAYLQEKYKKEND